MPVPSSGYVRVHNISEGCCRRSSYRGLPFETGYSSFPWSSLLDFLCELPVSIPASSSLNGIASDLRPNASLPVGRGFVTFPTIPQVVSNSRRRVLIRHQLYRICNGFKIFQFTLPLHPRPRSIKSCVSTVKDRDKRPFKVNPCLRWAGRAFGLRPRQASTSKPECRSVHFIYRQIL
jgi:hypothetical protein